MEEDIIKPIEVLKESDSAPSPIGERECECGCGYSFIPKRRDQIYLDRKHANYGYNHGARKNRDKNKNYFMNKLAVNDRVLDKYYNAGEGLEVEQLLMVLQADGFDSAYNVGVINLPDQQYFALFNYMFAIYQKEGFTIIKIKKR